VIGEGEEDYVAALTSVLPPNYEETIAKLS
jgi:hypothetical protein